MKIRYIPITQQPFCCVPACIQMVMVRRNIPLMSQEIIGNYLGLTIPKKYSNLLPKAKVAKPGPAGYGTRIDKEQYSLNNFLKKTKMGIKFDYYFPIDISSSREKIITLLKKDTYDILICFNIKLLFGEGYSDAGHVCVLDSISGDVAKIIDPSSKAPKYRKVKFSKLISSMIVHGKKNFGGFWIIS